MPLSVRSTNFINSTIAAAWPANTIVARNFTAQDAEAFRQNILDLDERKADKSYVDNGLAGKSDTSHTHDNRYYTESEVDTALATKANTADVYTKGQADAITNKLEMLPVNCGTISSLPTTINNSNVESDMVVLQSVLGTPSAQVSNWTVTTANGSLTISGTISGSTTLTLYLMKSR